MQLLLSAAMIVLAITAFIVTMRIADARSMLSVNADILTASPVLVLTFVGFVLAAIVIYHSSGFDHVAAVVLTGIHLILALVSGGVLLDALRKKNQEKLQMNSKNDKG